MSEPPERVRLVGFTVGTTLAVVVAVFAAYRLRNAFVAAHQVFGWVVACAVVALLLDSVVGLLQRVLPRWVSVIVVLLGGLAVLGAVLTGLVRELGNSLDELERAAPSAARGLEEKYDWAARVGVADRVRSLLEQLDRSLREETVGRALGTLPTYLVTGILMLFLLGYGRRYVNGAIGLVEDPARRAALREVLGQGATRGRTYILVTIAHAAVNGIVFGLFCWLVDLPAPLSLGVAVGVFTAVPLVGVIIGGLPALLLAFGSQAWRIGVLVVVVIVALQVVEAVLVRPVVDRRTVRLGPTVPVVVGLVAFELYGVGGAIYAVALAILGLAVLDAFGRHQGEDVDTADSGASDDAGDRQPEPA
jgi:predicted PurR-regulated permease PerM